MDAPADASTIEDPRLLVHAAIAELRERGKLVSTCTIQAVLRERHGVDMTFHAIINARRA